MNEIVCSDATCPYRDLDGFCTASEPVYPWCDDFITDVIDRYTEADLGPNWW